MTVGCLAGILLWAVFSWRPVLIELIEQCSRGGDSNPWVELARSGWKVLAESKTTITITIAGYQVSCASRSKCERQWQLLYLRTAEEHALTFHLKLNNLLSAGFGDVLSHLRNQANCQTDQ